MDEGAIIHHLKMVIAFCRKPIAWSLMISAKVLCFNHPEEATLPLRRLCQLPLCGLAAEERLQAIIPRQQVNIPHPTVLKSIGLFLYHQKEVQPKMPVPHLEIRIVQRLRAALPLPELPTKPEKNCSPSTTRNPKTTEENSRKSFIRKSCFRQMLHPDMQTGQPSGTPLRKRKSNGTHSLQGDSFLPCREKFRPKCIRR